MSYEVTRFTKPIKTGVPIPEADLNSPEALDIFRQQRIASSEGQEVMRVLRVGASGQPVAVPISSKVITHSHRGSI